MSHHSHHFPSTLVLLTAYCSYPTKCKISPSWPDLSNHLVLVLNLYYFTISNFHLPFTLTCYSSSPPSIPSMSYHFPSGSCLLHPAPLASQTFPVVFIICWHSTKSTSLHLFTFSSGPFFFISRNMVKNGITSVSFLGMNGLFKASLSLRLPMSFRLLWWTYCFCYRKKIVRHFLCIHGTVCSPRHKLPLSQFLFKVPCFAGCDVGGQELLG